MSKKLLKKLLLVGMPVGLIMLCTGILSNFGQPSRNTAITNGRVTSCKITKSSWPNIFGRNYAYCEWYSETLKKKIESLSVSSNFRSGKIYMVRTTNKALEYIHADDEKVLKSLFGLSTCMSNSNLKRLNDEFTRIWLDL